MRNRLIIALAVVFLGSVVLASRTEAAPVTLAQARAAATTFVADQAAASDSAGARLGKCRRITVGRVRCMAFEWDTPLVGRNAGLTADFLYEVRVVGRRHSLRLACALPLECGTETVAR